MDERNQQLKLYYDTHNCPVCGFDNMNYEGKHERDSTYDRMWCPKCEWSCIEMELWQFYPKTNY
jgi:hypothetical protein